MMLPRAEIELRITGNKRIKNIDWTSNLEKVTDAVIDIHLDKQCKNVCAVQSRADSVIVQHEKYLISQKLFRSLVCPKSPFTR